MNSLIQNLLKETASKGLASKISSQLGISESQVNSALSMLMPEILSGVKENTKDENSAQQLQNTLKKHHSDGGIFNQLDALVSNPDSAKGSKILGHIFGNNSEKQTAIEKNVAEKSGVDSNIVSQIFAIAAPLVMGELGKSVGKSGNTSMLTSLLDQNNDGSIIDDIFRLGMKFFKK
ncbi:TPA: DUF937 domain-containing protein [Candidatus Gracilibacteria bacterium]|nr:DUF937 domain-containing protein [Candidatus Gracilibacteria bacterium]